ncbi:MAG: prepilin-type N-terminal cleavage/methylation domain-containing protein, partial [Phycisphaerales bacterium]|nr:prepilin-type N-terminal cleavage/methylation domain-containing protein [Phycisphaerales bacterium]
MNRRGLSLIEMIIAIGITAVIGAAIASMMAAATNSLTSKDDGRQSAIRLATTQVRLGAYIAPSRCIVDKSNTHVTLWLEDS